MIGKEGLTQQSQITIYTRFNRDKKWQPIIEAEINYILDQYSNPVGGIEVSIDQTQSEPLDPFGNRVGGIGIKLQEKLNDTEIVHFLSIFVVPSDENTKQSHLILEMTADGSEKSAIDTLVDYAGDLLLPIYKLAAGIESSKKLRAHLKANRLSIVSQTPFFGTRPRRAVGLEWLATSELSIERIRLDQRVYDAAQKELREIRQNVKNGIVFGLNEDHSAQEAEDSVQSTPALSYLKIIKKRIADNHDPEIADHVTRATGELTFASANPEEKPAFEVGIAILARPMIMLVSVLFFATIVIDVAFDILDGCFSRGETQLTLCSHDKNRLFPIDSSREALGLAFESARYIGDLIARSFINVFSLLGLLVVLFFYTLRKSESSNTPCDSDPDIGTLHEIVARENRTSQQNHMVSITSVIPSGFRKYFTLPLGLMAVAKAHDPKLNIARPRFLGTIGTIHSARFVRIPGTNKLVFVSNYNGSWESYLEDFIQKGSAGMTGIWSNCEGFPETEFLMQKGCEDGDRFKRFARRSMIPTRLWYSAYPDQTAAQIRRNALVTRGLSVQSTGINAEAWIDLFGSTQRPEKSIEFEDVQSIMFSGNGNRKRTHGVCQTITFPEDASLTDLQKWVGQITAHVNLGKTDKDISKPAIYLAFSSIGLERLGLPNASSSPSTVTTAESSGFPSVFRFGMDHPSRRNVLGDTGVNAVENWEWGHNTKSPNSHHGEKRLPTHAVVLIYAHTEDALKSARELIEGIWVNTISSPGSHAQGPAIEFSPFPPPSSNEAITEPFGWVDGLSQPKIRGASWKHRPDPVNTVEAGEFILGYKDNRDYFPPTPVVKVEHDQGDYLPSPPANLAQEFPSFDPAKIKDFGRNGSFLVIRQLEQDVAGFNGWIKEEVDRLNANQINEQNKVSADQVGAKLVGRWKSGAPLTRYPEQDPCKPRKDYANNFLYRTEDPQGHGCPLGAHIRRSFPRDSLDFKSSDALTIANRHRILRRGRSYFNEAGGKAGTMFICVNADIERQFEFIQQSWINGSQFHTLPGEIDPITGQGTGSGNFTIPTTNGPGTLKGLESFIRMKGGGYFFLPSRRALDFLADGLATTATPPHTQDSEARYFSLGTEDHIT